MSVEPLLSKWEVKRLEELSSAIQYGYTAKATTERLGPKLLRITDIQNDAVDWDEVPFCEINAKEIGKYRLGKNDLLFARTGATVGKSYLIPGSIPESIFASYLIRVRLLETVYPKYVAYFFRSGDYWRQITENQAGIGQPNVNGTKLAQIKIPVAPLNQQGLIVAEIEKQFSRLDEAVANLKRVKANLKRNKAAVLKAAVEGALVPIKSRQTTKIGEVADLVTKGSSPNWQGFMYADSGVVFVRSQNVGWGNLDLSDVAHLPPAFNEKERKSVLRTGDVLLNIVGASIGRAAVATPEIEGGNVNQAVAVIRLNKERMLPKYLMLNLLSPGTQAAIHAEKVDVARANVSLSDIKDFSVLFPSLAEQGTMVAEVERRLSVIEALEAAVQANHTRADRLRQSILQQAFSGKLPMREMPVISRGAVGVQRSV